MQGKKINLNPITIIGVWTVTMIVLTPILMVVSEIGASGGEQKAFTTLGNMIIVTIIGASVLSIVTPFLFKQWFKKNIITAIVIILSTAVPSFSFLWIRFFKNPYGFIETTEQVDGNTIETKKEYYDMDKRQLRSVSYYKNELKDSIWATYNKQGEIIQQKTYKNNKIIQE
jgi:hypothetical protein